MKLEKIILGHNPLFGIDHLSQENGNMKEMMFEDQRLLLEVLLNAKENDVNAMMMSTHPRALQVIEMIKNNPVISNMKIYPLLPYIAKYVRKANEKGLVNVLMESLEKASFAQKVSIVLNGSQGILKKDMSKIIKLLVDIEFLPFQGLNIGAIFIHDSLTDLALGLGAEQLLEVFRDHVEEKYNVKAGFVTKNVYNFREKMDARGWNDYLVMASYNKTGFYVNPSLEKATEAIERSGMDFIAMNTLSGGGVKPEDAYSYIGNVKNIKSIVVGMSKKEHIKETVASIHKYIL